MLDFLRAFIASESGAVTVDWVVLTAGVVGIALVIVALVSPGFENLSIDTRNALANARPETHPFNTNTDVTAANDIALE